MSKKTKHSQILQNSSVFAAGGVFRYLAGFSVLFLIAAVIIFSPFILQGKTMIYTNDGYYQHYNSLVYYSSYLKGIVRTLFTEHRFEIPMLDMSVGLGSDILTTFHYYCIGDLLYLLAAFVPETKIEYFHSFLIIFRMYLAGLSFSAFAFEHGKRDKAVMAGALLYAFSGYMLIPGIRHIMFEPAAIYLPLVLMGIERVCKNKKPYVFIIATALAAMSNFYFFYIIVEFAILYTAFRFFTIYPYEKKDALAIYIKEKVVLAGRLVGKLLAYAVLSVMIASVIFLPVIMAMLSSQRMGVKHFLPLFYDWKYYVINFAGFMTTQYITEGTFYTYYGFGALAILSCTIFFLIKRKSAVNTALKIAFLMMLGFMLIPFFGYALSGFSYVNNRWAFAFSMLTAYITASVIGAWEEITADIIKKSAVIMLIYGIICYASRTVRSEVVLAGVCIIFMSLLLLAMKKEFSNVFIERAFLFAALLSVVVNGLYAYGELDGMLQRGVPTQSLLNNPAAVVRDFSTVTYEDSSDNIPNSQIYPENGDFFRFEAENINDVQNMSWHENTHGTDFYFSVLNGYVSEFFAKMEMSNTTEYRFRNLDARLIPDLISGVRFAMVREGEEQRLPVSYDKESYKASVGDSFVLYENENALPIGFTSDRIISDKAFEESEAIDRQRALSMGILINDQEDCDKLSAKECYEEVQIASDYKEPEFSVECSDNVSYDGAGFTVTGENAEVVISYGKNKVSEGAASADTADLSEIYLEFNDFDYQDINPAEFTQPENGSLAARLEYYRMKRNFIPEDKGYFYLTGANGKTEYNINNSRQPAYSGRHNYMYKLGNSVEDNGEITITFKKPGRFTFSRMRVLLQPTKAICEEAKLLGENALRQVRLDTNSIIGNITADSDRLLLLSVPYSKGFKAFVDGKETRIYRADIMYMAIEVPQGEHTIEFKYETPYVKMGLAISLLGIVIFAVFVFLSKKRHIDFNKQ